MNQPLVPPHIWKALEDLRTAEYDGQVVLKVSKGTIVNVYAQQRITIAEATKLAQVGELTPAI